MHHIYLHNTKESEHIANATLNEGPACREHADSAEHPTDPTGSGGHASVVLSTIL